MKGNLVIFNNKIRVFTAIRQERLSKSSLAKRETTDPFMAVLKMAFFFHHKYSNKPKMLDIPAQKRNLFNLYPLTNGYLRERC